LQIRVYESLDDLKTLLPAWEGLLSESPGATIFSTWEWLAPWWHVFGKGQKLHVLALLDGSSQLVGLAPLALTTQPVLPGLRFRVLRLMGDGSEDSDNLDLPVRPGYEKQFTAALLDHLTTAIRWDFCGLNTLPSHSLVGNALMRELDDRRWTCFTNARPWSFVEMPNSWEQYLQQLTSKERGKIGLRTRRLEKRYDVCYLKGTESTLDSALDTLFRLHRDRWGVRGESGSFKSQKRRQFYEEVSLMLLKRGWLEFWLLEVDKKRVAAQFGLRYSTTVFSLQEGFDPAFSADSVGFVLRAHVLKELIGRGVRRYDFLAGQDSSKARWGTQVGNYVDLHFARPLTKGSFYLRSVRGAAQGKAWLRHRLPKGAWTLLHELNLRLQRVRKPLVS